MQNIFRGYKMYIKNITKTDINVNSIKMTSEEVKEFTDTFKKTQEFKNLKREKYIEETVKVQNE